MFAVRHCVKVPASVPKVPQLAHSDIHDNDIYDSDDPIDIVQPHSHAVTRPHPGPDDRGPDATQVHSRDIDAADPASNLARPGRAAHGRPERCTLGRGDGDPQRDHDDRAFAGFGRERHGD